LKVSLLGLRELIASAGALGFSRGTFKSKVAGHGRHIRWKVEIRVPSVGSTTLDQSGWHLAEVGVKDWIEVGRQCRHQLHRFDYLHSKRVAQLVLRALERLMQPVRNMRRGLPPRNDAQVRVRATDMVSEMQRAAARRQSRRFKRQSRRRLGSGKSGKGKGRADAGASMLSP